jgi:hypothetical protein
MNATLLAPSPRAAARRQAAPKVPVELRQEAERLLRDLAFVYRLARAASADLVRQRAAEG